MSRNEDELIPKVAAFDLAVRYAYWKHPHMDCGQPVAWGELGEAGRAREYKCLEEFLARGSQGRSDAGVAQAQGEASGQGQEEKAAV